MSANTNVERLLPSLYAFLSADPAPSPIAGALPTTATNATVPPSTGNPCESFSQAQSVADSYERWRRCIEVWRRLIGQDVVFLSLLLHSGCLWSPDYAAIGAAKQKIAQTRTHTRASTRDATRRTAASLPDGGTTGKRKGKRGQHAAAEAAVHAARAAHAAAAEAHEKLTRACPASMWALHVLHFLRLEEVYAVPSSACVGDGEAAAANKNRDWGEAESSFGGADSNEDVDDASGSDEATDSGSSSLSSGSSGSDDDANESADSGGSVGGKTRPRAAKRGRWHTQGNVTASHSRQQDTLSRCRKRVKFGDEMKSAVSPASPTSPSASYASAPPRQLAASSSLLPKLNSKYRSSKKELQHHLDFSLAALRQEQEERERRRRGVCTVNGKLRRSEDGEEYSHPVGASDAATTDSAAQVPLPSARAHALFLRATVSLVSEEEPLVQQVAAALVEDWLDLLTPADALPSISTASAGARGSGSLTKTMAASAAAKGSAPQATCPQIGGVKPQQESADHEADTKSGDTEMSREAAARLQQQQREARHYWLSCLMKMVAFLDGMHSALREENVHLAAVMARQGIAPHEVEDIFTKSLPATFNCVLVEEVLQTAYAAPLLWMPPPVLLLPFHFLARGSRIGVWVPATGTPTESHAMTGAVPAASSSSRAQGRFVLHVVDSYGLQLRPSPPTSVVHSAVAGPTETDGGTSLSAGRSSALDQSVTKLACKGGEVEKAPTTLRLVFGLRSAEPEVLLDARCRSWVNALLPLWQSPAPASQGSEHPSVATAVSPGFDQREDADTDQQTPMRSWSCTQAATAGCPRVDLYVARTIVMLFIPAQSAPGSTSNPTGSARAASSGSGNSTAAPADASTESNDKSEATAKRPRRGGVRGHYKRVALSPEAIAVRRRHPKLFHALQPCLRSSGSKVRDFASFDSHSGAGGVSGSSNSDPTQLILLYGLARGEEAAALRHLGFSVRTGSHHRLGRSGGPAGGAAPSATQEDPSSSSSALSYSALPSHQHRDSGGGAKGSSGRLTLARDALGTTLEGLCLIARRVMSLNGLYAAAPAAVPGSGGSGKGEVGSDASKVLTAGSRSGLAGQGVRASTTLSPAHESEVLGTVAATLVLTALFLCHNLMDELLEQPALVLWTTELASYVLDVSLLMSRPIPRLLRADGLALSLLLQPAQSLLLMVGLVATLVSREVQHPEANSTPPTSSSLLSNTQMWHPWWTVFRSTVLRDVALPSCLYGGVWVLVAKAEDAVALAAAQARWETSGHLQAAAGRRANAEISEVETGRRAAVGGDHASVEAVSASSGGRSSGSGGSEMSRGRRGGWGGGRRLLHLTQPAAPKKAAAASSSGTSAGGSTTTAASSTAAATAADTPALSRHRLPVLLPSAATAPAASRPAAASLPGAPVAAVSSVSHPWMYGPAVLHQPSLSQHPTDVSLISPRARVAQLRVISAAEMSCLMEGGPLTTQPGPVPEPTQHPGKQTPARWPLPPRSGHDSQSGAAASALWLALEATCLQWPSSTTNQ
ncbi:hypothetical protein ABL78_7619 [Leptomonas seymouri]|uniref:Uncharacterized protein n=1 Tax=Leptomonas seymouri TaxID=5684 RepID=A0A0N1PBC3_LEPSE|nr:hypothetical protein ABL78_7619 [Leptomonas seymouri]|eukprot:KPI83351.1 hypothetical protein ABL78_7619 [Leptomonas seymouri]